MIVRIAVSLVACLITVLPGAPALAGDDPGVPVFHDREVKRDKAGDVQADGSTPIDIRRVQYDHYKTGDNERFVVTVRFASRVRKGSELSWGTSTGPGGYSLEVHVEGRRRLPSSSATTERSGAPTSAVPSRDAPSRSRSRGESSARPTSWSACDSGPSSGSRAWSGPGSTRR